MVRGPIGPGKTCAVEAKDHVQVLNTNIVNYLVVSPLHKGAVNIAEGNQALRGQAGRKGNGMLFGNAYVKCPVRHGLHHDVQGRAGRHGGRNAHDFIVLFGQFHQGMAKNILVFGWLRGFVNLFMDFAGYLIELTRGMPLGLVFFGQGKAFAFGGNTVQDFWSRNIAADP